jgi:hypothetical protein
MVIILTRLGYPQPILAFREEGPLTLRVGVPFSKVWKRASDKVESLEKSRCLLEKVRSDNGLMESF